VRADTGVSAARVEFVVHTVTSGEASFLTNAFVVESATGVVVVDAMMVRSEARRVRDVVDRIGKPLAALIITHGHPDHYVGAAEIVGDDDVPIIATAGVAATIARDDAAKSARWQPHFAGDWPTVRPRPDRMVAGGEAIELAGLRWSVREYGAGESHCDSVWVVEGAAAFIGDLCFNRVHAFVNDGHSGAWLATLDVVEADLADVAMAYTGHGQAGDPTTLCRAQAAYLQAYRAAVRELALGSPRLDDAAKAALRDRMIQFLGGDLLAAFITAGADSVAAELAAEAA
jgi:glyoxylase-like metal-dependent hydrolase (beta-lactamase superfamily II)